MATELLVEYLELEPGMLTLHEAATPGGPLIVSGPFSKYGIKNDNGRVYTEELWRGIIENGSSRPMERITGRGMFGHLTHPTDGKTDLREASHIITKLQLAPNGLVLGEAEILPTTRGKDLRAIIESGCRVGISSRGQGSVNRTNNTVQNDFVLESFDFVSTPSTPGAYPKPTSGYTAQKTYAVRSEELSSPADILLSTQRLMEDAKKSIKNLSVAAQFVPRLLDAESKLGGLSAAEAPLGASSLLEELKAIRAAIEESYPQNNVAEARFGGFGAMNYQTGQQGPAMPVEARMYILEHDLGQKNETIELLENHNQLLQQKLQATEAIAEELGKMYREVYNPAMEVAECLDAAEKLVEAQHQQIEAYKTQSLSESSGNGEPSEREAAAFAIMEELLGHIQKSALFTEELAARYVALEKLTESTLSISKAMILEGTKEQLLSQVDESLQDQLAAMLDESYSVEDMQNKFELIQTIAESVAAPYQMAMEQNNQAAQGAKLQESKIQESYTREPLPNWNAQAPAAQSRQQRQLLESAANQEVGSAEARQVHMAMRLAAHLGERSR